MKALRRLCAALVLTLALSLSAFAGDISTGFTDPPPPPPASQETITSDSSTTLEGQIDTPLTGDIETGVVATDSAVLNLLESVLSIF